jgi:hypothetical protein
MPEVYFFAFENLFTNSLVHQRGKWYRNEPISNDPGNGKKKKEKKDIFRVIQEPVKYSFNLHDEKYVFGKQN